MPRAGPRPNSARRAVMKAVKAWARSGGSRSRKTRLKVSWLGGPCGRSMISRRSSSRPAAKSAMSTQLLAPHRVAASDTNRIMPRSCRALTSRGSFTARKIHKSAAIRPPHQRESPLRIPFPTARNTQMQFPCMAAAHVPPATAFATKPRLALAMIERAMAAGVPFGWVAADSVYGVGEIEMALRRWAKGYVLGVNATQLFNSWGDKPPVAGTAEEIAQGLDPSAWQRLSAGEGTKGARLYDWAYCELADLEAAEYDHDRIGLWTRGLLIRRNIADGDLAFFSTWCPHGTDIATLVTVEGHRWAIEDAFETAKTELGLDHNETRSWHGWHRHVSLVMMAFALMAAVRRQANTTSPPKTNSGMRTIGL